MVPLQPQGSLATPHVEMNPLMAIKPAGPLILALNCGSSSIKFALFDPSRIAHGRKPEWSGSVEDVGSDAPLFKADGVQAHTVHAGDADSHPAALELVRKCVDERLGGRTLVAVAHRVVHGGSKYSQPVRVDAAVFADLVSYIPLAPLHQPFALDAIKLFLAALPEVAQIACFDTAFHHTLPEVERMLPLSREAWQQGIRRYGFHGLSYQFVAQAIDEHYGDRARQRVIVAHLGSGASLCAMRDLQSVATTMGFSALDGLMMGTRCGALDPGVLFYMLETGKLSPDRLAQVLYHESGLLGLSGISSDPRALLARENEEPARQALTLYVRSIVREICALTGALGGFDMLVFTAGIGEHNAVVRERVCAKLGFFGLTLDADANVSNKPVISRTDSKVFVAIEPTNEEWVAASSAATLISN